MLNTKNGNASGQDAIEKVIESITQDNVKFVIFFASTKYDFKEVSQKIKQSFPSIDVVGCTTAGEIGSKGITEDTISAMSIASDDFQTSVCVMKDIKLKSMLAKSELLKSAEKLGIKPNDTKNSFGITLIDGMQASEEKVLSTITGCFSDLPLVGGSAGDDLQFKETLVSSNGEVYKNAAIVVFVKTSHKFFMYKENIYEPTDIELKVTKVDTSNRYVSEFNGKPAAEEYARVLGVPVSEISNYFMSNPFGRQYLDDIWITSPYNVIENKQLALYALLMQNSTVKLLKPKDPVAETRKTMEAIKENVPNCKGILVFNCILRFLQFKKENACEAVYNEYPKDIACCGFSTYGEQLGKYQINQTLTLVAFGE